MDGNNKIICVQNKEGEEESEQKEEEESDKKQNCIGGPWV